MKTNNFKLQEAFAGKMWLITPSGLRGFYNTIESLDDIKAAAEFFGSRPAATLSRDGIGEISIKNALVDEIPPAYEKLGFCTSYETVQNEFEGLLDQGAKAILLNIDSPGGMVSGCIEIAEMIESSPVPVVAYIKNCGCSAAYKIAAGADVIFASKSATVGNIGAIWSMMNDSKYLEAIGITFDTFTNEGADLKSTGYLDNLTESQAAFIQESINETGKAFRDHVEASREVDEEVFRAGWYSGERAVALGLIDQVGSKSEALQYLTTEIK